jgi:hypothetical protein
VQLADSEKAIGDLEKEKAVLDRKLLELEAVRLPSGTSWSG